MNQSMIFSGATSVLHDPLPSPTMLSLISLPRKKKYPTCPCCHLIFAKEADIKLHLGDEKWTEFQETEHRGDYKCEQCCLFFKHEKGFRQHYGKIHITKYKYSKCVLCEKKFRNKYALKFHIKQVHEKATREHCPMCGKELYNKYLIPQHLIRCNLRHSIRN